MIDWTQTSRRPSEAWTQEQFIEHHRVDARLSRKEWDRYLIAVECGCSEEFCHGWAAMPRTAWKRQQQEARRKELHG